jgi:hypothetical protein
MSKIAVIALGTRGDVQPLALLAWQLQREDSNHAEIQVSLITHAAHEVRMPRISTDSSSSSSSSSKPSLGCHMTSRTVERDSCYHEDAIEHYAWCDTV